MAGGLLQYSGLVTKIKAMDGRLLEKEELERIMDFQSVHETIAYLREQDRYGRIYAGHDEIQHRGQVEALIHNSIREDYESLYRFSNQEQRQALKLYEPHLKYQSSLVEMEEAYFPDVWKKIGKFENQKMQRVLREIYGTQIDWLNIMCMYRAKRFFGQGTAELYGMLIPVHYKLKKSEIQQMAEAEQIPDFVKILGNSAYFKGKEALVKMQDEISYHQVIRKMYHRVCRKYPLSIAPVFRYLYEKEQEIEHLTTVLEGIRYQVPAKDIRELILNTL